MGQTHPSTPQQRAQLALTMLAHQGQYGLVTQLSTQECVSRPTLYAWREQARRALADCFCPAAPSPSLDAPLARHILTLWIAHGSERSIQSCLHELTRQTISLATIQAVLTQAEQRALAWMESHLPLAARALALDEIYANNRRGAYLSAVDVHSGAVWAASGPLAVDSESWTLLLWSLQERGMCWDQLVADGGQALRAACAAVTPEIAVQSDLWHLFAECGQVVARLERSLHSSEAQSVVVARQAARVACGHKPRGRTPKTDLQAHDHSVQAARQTLENARYLSYELKRVLEVVVIDRRGLLTPEQREQEITAVLELFDEVACAAAERGARLG